MDPEKTQIPANSSSTPQPPAPVYNINNSRRQVTDQSPKNIATWLEIIGFGALLSLLTYVLLSFAIELLLRAFYTIPLFGIIFAVFIGKTYILLGCVLASAAVYYGMKIRKLDISFLVTVGASISAYYATSILLTLVPYGERQPFVERPFTIPAFLVSGVIIFLLYYTLYAYVSLKSMSLVFIIVVAATTGFFIAGKDIAAKDSQSYRKNLNTADFATYVPHSPPSGWSNLERCAADNSNEKQSETCHVSFGKTAKNTYGSDAQVKQFVYSNDLAPYLPAAGKCNLYAVSDMGSARPDYRQSYIKKTRQGYKENGLPDLYSVNKNTQCREIGRSKYGAVYAETYELSEESKQRAREGGQTDLLVEGQLYTGDIYAKVNQTVVMLNMGQDYKVRPQLSHIIEFYNSLTPGKGLRVY